MLDTFLGENIWPGIIVWSLLYISDYYLTIYGARLYQNHARRYIVFEGSYELTPYFQADINALRRLSPRFIWSLSMTWLALSLVWLLGVWFFQVPETFSLVIGALILVEAVVHIRHIRNIVLFRLTRQDDGGLTGKIEYARWVTLRLSSVEMLSFAALFLLIFLVTGSWFFLGGVLRTLAEGLKHIRLARKARSTSPSAGSAG